MTKSGADHIQALKDDRHVYIDGELTTDVTSHRAFKNAVSTAAQLYDFQCKSENLKLMTFVSPDTGDHVNRAWQLPTSYDELLTRRRALEAWAETHVGYLGRSPDHVASCLAGMYMGIETFEAYDKRRAGALRDYYRYARDNDLYLTYVIINPQADRSKSASDQQDEDLTVRLVDEDNEGITVRGAKMLGTSCIMANELLVTCIQPLKPDDAPYALTFMAPLGLKGLKIISRKSYEQSAVSNFDNPLSSRFDENDAVIYFDDAKIPWERVFVAQSPEMCLKQFHETPAHIFQNYQAQIRLMVKLRFLVGLARKVAETNGIIGFPQVRETLGQLAAETGMVEGLLNGMEAKGHQVGPYYVPDRHIMYTAQVLTQQLYTKFTNTLRDLAGGGMIMLPASFRDFNNPEIAELIEKTQQSPVSNSEERVKLFKLAWDAVGSEFGSRHVQYEMFYAGASYVTKNHSFRTFDWDGATRLTDSILDSYQLADETNRSRGSK